MARDTEFHMVVPNAKVAQAEAAMASIFDPLGYSGPYLTIDIQNASEVVTHKAMSGPIPLEHAAAVRSVVLGATPGAKGRDINPRRGGRMRWNDDDGAVDTPATGNGPAGRFGQLLSDKLPGHSIKRPELE